MDGACLTGIVYNVDSTKISVLELRGGSLHSVKDHAMTGLNVVRHILLAGNLSAKLATGCH